MKHFNCLFLLLIVGMVSIARADDFFDLRFVHFQSTRPSGGPAVFKHVYWKEWPDKQKEGDFFVPCLEVKFNVKEQIKATSVFAHAYFYDQNRSLIGQTLAPAVANWGDNRKYDLPVIIPSGKEQIMFIAVPDDVLKQQDWTAVVVFGDTKGVDAIHYGGSGDLADYDYPEKASLENKFGPSIERATAMDPLVEYAVETNNPNQPQLTLFLRPPLGMTDASQANGVLCLSLLAGSLEQVKRQLQGFEAGQDLSGILKFAEDHKLIIICWGSRGLWDPTRNWDDLNPDEAARIDSAFNQISDAWARGIRYFVRQYGIPSNGYLLWGVSGSAQYACRIALRKPDYFLAVHVHIPSSFDKPTPGGRRVLWCLTTGERESGYQRSLRFYSQCRALGYPMIYKAIPGLGHNASPIADDLGQKFFEYALSVRDQRLAYDESLTSPYGQNRVLVDDSPDLHPWLASFQTPDYVGDILNQCEYPYAQQGMIPVGFRVPLPSKEIAEAWEH